MKTRWMVAAALAAAGVTQADVKTETVEYRDGGVVLKGYLAYDPELVRARKGGAPGVLVVPEWWGLNDYVKGRARELAELGYVAFAADMYGEGKTTTDPREAGTLAGGVTGDVSAWRSRAAAALRALQEREETDDDSIAAIGFCFGGSTVLQMAYAGMPLDGVVAFHSSLPAPSEAEKAAMRSPVLVLHGTDDPMAPMEKVVALIEAMEGAPVDWSVELYGGAQHAFTNPDADRAGIPGVKHDAAAEEASWASMKAFLERRTGD